MRLKKILVAVIAIALLFTNTMGFGNVVNAAALERLVFCQDSDNLLIIPGQTIHFSIPIQAVGSFVNNPQIEFTTSTGAPFSILNPKLMVSTYTVTDISSSSPTNLEFDVKVKETAGIGTYPVTIKFTFYNYLSSSYDTAQLSTHFQVTDEKAPVQLTISGVSYSKSLAGSTTDLSFTIKNEGDITARSVYYSIDYSKSGIEANYTTKKIKINDLKKGDTQNVTLPIKILNTARAGNNDLTVNFEYKNLDGDKFTDSYGIAINVKQNDSAPVLQFDKVTTKGELKPGNDIKLIATLVNKGSTSAENIAISVDPASVGKDSFIKNYLTDAINVSLIDTKSSKNVEIPLSVSKYASGGLKEVKLNVTYTDGAGVPYSLSTSVFLDVKGANPDSAPNIVISNVVQSPTIPVAGDKLEIAFDLENKGSTDLSELKISPANLTGDTFIPLNSTPYQFIEKLAAGEKKRITIPFVVSDGIKEGMNNLTIKYTYAGNTTGETVDIPVRDVQNDLGSNSKPKLIVSKYSTDMDQLKAGSTFKLTFDIYNTNTSVAAKNITVTMTQADNIFNVTQGSNSFFIAKIAPGETVEETLELKVKIDATTKAYPVDITIEYEYDGAKANPTTGEIGEKRVEKLNLQAEENARPVVDSVYVYAWDGPVIMGSPATLSFDFFNMGKSPLNNVIATVEGDFTKSDGSMQFIGNVAAGTSSHVEFDVIPGMAGTANGTLKITFEDSNGEPVGFTSTFSQDVMPAASVDPNMGGDGSGEVFNPTPLAKKAILQPWLFVIVQIVIVIVFIPVTRKIILTVYKSKLRKKDEESL